MHLLGEGLLSLLYLSNSLRLLPCHTFHHMLPVRLPTCGHMAETSVPRHRSLQNLSRFFAGQMQQHKCAELNIKSHFKDMKRIEMHCSKVLVLSILRKAIVLQPNQLCLLSSCHHNKGFDADFLQKHRRRRALKSSSNGHL